MTGGFRIFLTTKWYLERGVAQWLAHLVRDQGVGGSNPLTPTMMPFRKVETRWKIINVGAWRSPVAQLHGVQKVAGSNPAAPTILFSSQAKLKGPHGP